MVNLKVGETQFFLRDFILHHRIFRLLIYYILFGEILSCKMNEWVNNIVIFHWFVHPTDRRMHREMFQIETWLVNTVVLIMILITCEITLANFVVNLYIGSLFIVCIYRMTFQADSYNCCWRILFASVVLLTIRTCFKRIVSCISCKSTGPFLIRNYTFWKHLTAYGKNVWLS